jgi:hypothetical protein
MSTNSKSPHTRTGILTPAVLLLPLLLLSATDRAAVALSYSIPVVVSTWTVLELGAFLTDKCNVSHDAVALLGKEGIRGRDIAAIWALWSQSEWSEYLGKDGFNLGVGDRVRVKAAVTRTETGVYLAFEAELRRPDGPDVIVNEATAANNDYSVIIDAACSY